MFSKSVLASADALSGNLNDAGYQTSFDPLAPVSGAAPPAFDETSRLAIYTRTDDLDPSSAIRPLLRIDATAIVDSASSPGLGVDNIGTRAAADIGSATILLTDNPRLMMGILGLSVSANMIHSEADASFVFGANRGFLGGDASFGRLAIGGALIGKSLTFSGDAHANTVLFRSASVTITLDKQTLSGFFPPTPVLPGPIPPVAPPPNRITTDAIDIQLTNAPLFGGKVSGEIRIGETSASLFPPMHA